MSNRLYSLFEVTNRQWLEPIKEPADQYLARLAGLLIPSCQNINQKALMKAIR